MKHIGERIKSLRLEQGLTLKELGEAIDFNYSNLSKIERGTRKPAIEVLESLSNYFDIDISYFFTGERRIHKKDNPEENLLVYLSEEMKRHNISLEELKKIIREIDQVRNTSKSN
ncbi:helix-turn-helix domain-containing protein [Alkalihalobacterium elongatum]|uniref:helix-turn-helix domain-containing protein n=1 Tax=Alkalihalobacterium elongatum TaxID=2675466 RepID=UPI001C2008C8|nr:helix-turn-helix transcriptional regulator [Alkalihalobacterium elongatum]